MSHNPKYIGWFSCGVTSAVACKIAIDEGKDIDLWYLETGGEHEDNKRFIADCERWYGRKINIARNPKFSCPLDVARKELFNTPYGAPCTKYLKKEVRQKQVMPAYPDDVIHILGFEYTKHEVNRALRWKEQQTPNCYFPLIEHRLTKKDCLLMLKKAGIEIPTMYKLGYHNNNCIGCFKAGKGYWNKIRVDFPEVFNATSEVEISTKHTVLKENGKPLYLKDLKPNAGYHTDLDIPDCGLFCDLEIEGLPVLELEEARKELLNVNKS